MTLYNTVTVNPGSTGTLATAVSATTLNKAGSGVLKLNGNASFGSVTIAYAGNPSGTVSYGVVTVGSGVTLSVGPGSVYIGVGTGSANNGGQLVGTLDVSAASSFVASVGYFKVGGTVGGVGYLYLGTSNTITATNEFGVEHGNWGFPNGYGTVTTAAGGTTTIHTPAMYVGHNTPNSTTGGSGTFTNGSGATLNLDGLSGGRAALYIGVLSSGNGGSSPNPNVLDLSGGGTGLASLKLSSLVVGQLQGGNNSVTGTLILSSNSGNQLDISGTGNVVLIADSGGNGSNTGTLTFGGGTGTVTSADDSAAILIANKRSTGTPTGTLNLYGGKLTITTAGAAISGGGGTSTLVLSNCTLAAGAPSTNWIWGLTTATLKTNAVFDTGTNGIAIPQVFSGTGNLIKTGSGSMILSGTNTYTGETTVSNGNLLVNGTITSTVSVASPGGFGGSGNVNGNVTFSSGASGVFILGGALNITGSLVLSGNNTAHLILPAGATNGLYRVGYYNSSGSSGKFEPLAVIDSGSASNGTPAIIMGNGTIDVQIAPPGFLLTIR